MRRPDTAHHSHTLAYELHLPEHDEHLHIILNAYRERLSFDLPPLPEEHFWRRIVDTARPSPDDFCDPDTAPPVNTERYPVEARSAVVLMDQAQR